MAPTLGVSASAPDLGSALNCGGRQIKDRAKLQNLLAKATSGPPQRPPPLRSLGGAPRSAPAPRLTAANLAEASRAPVGRSASLGAIGARGGGSSASMPAHTENAGAYINKLMGKDGTGNGSLDWRLVQELDAVDDLLQEEQSRKLHAAQRQLLRDQLNSQTNDSKRRNQDNRSDQRKWGDKLQADADSFWQEQCEKREMNREAQLRFNQERADLLEMTNRRRMKEKERDVEIERQMHERSVVARQIEVARDEEKKKRVMAAGQKVAEARVMAAEAKKDKARLEATREAELIKVQKEQMDEQDRQRSAKFQAVREKMDKQMKTMEAASARTAGGYPTAAESEAQVKREFDAKLKKDFDVDQEKQLKIQEMALEGKKAQRGLLEALNDKRAQERDESMRIAKEFRRDAEAAIQEEKNKVNDRRKQAKDHADFLLKQMQQRSSIIPGRHGHEQMNEAEKAINRGRLDRANNSESLQLLFRNKQLQYRLAGK